MKWIAGVRKSQIGIQAIDGEFGKIPITDQSIFVGLIYSAYQANIPDPNKIKVDVYRAKTRGVWTSSYIIVVRMDSMEYILATRKEVESFSYLDLYPVQSCPAWGIIPDEPYYPTTFEAPHSFYKFYFQDRIKQYNVFHLPTIYQGWFYDEEYDDCLVIDVTKGLIFGCNVNIFHIKKFSYFVPDLRYQSLMYNWDKQEFSNILSDFCFVTNSYAMMDDISILTIRAMGESPSVVDITGAHKYIISADQNIEDYTYSDYQMKGRSYGGWANILNLPDKMIARLNEYYKETYAKILETNIMAIRTNDANNPFNYVKLNQMIIDNGKQLGLCKAIRLSNNNKRISLALHNYVDKYFNAWWRL
jgi:hypothetical protein